MLMSRPIKHDRGARRTGMSLMEILVVLAIFALSTAVIMPSTSKMMDQATSHAVFFEFQREVSSLRREANRTQTALKLVDPAEPNKDLVDDRKIVLKAPWRYTMAPALQIDEGGGCSTTNANLLKGYEVVMSLRTEDGNCQFMRLQKVAQPPREPSSSQ